MAMVNILIAEMEDHDEAARIAELKVIRRRLRDQQDPFDLPDSHFRCIFRISRDIAIDLTTQLRPFLRRERINGLSVESQILCAVRFFAVGSYQRSVGQDFLIAMSQTSVSRCIRKVSATIDTNMLRQWVKFPGTPQQQLEARAKFTRAPQPFPGAIGAIDCTHVAIIAPKIHEEAYVNHHGFHSVNVQMVCDPQLQILNVNARFPGSRHDAAIWVQSSLRRLMEICYANGERRMWLLGDSGYPLEPWLMTPITNAIEGTREHAYTRAHCQARCIIERCFSLLKMIWRCLSKQRILMYDPETAGHIINSCAVLHNMRLHYGIIDDVIVGEDQAPCNIAVQEAVPMLPRERLAEGRRIRDYIVNQHF